MRIICVLFISLGFSAASLAQTLPVNQPNTYATSGNPLYWKNRLPHPGYWQQDIHYRISAELDYQTGIVKGRSLLTYTNNSPDTLHEVYFHLYQNAFQPGSYLHQLTLANHTKPKYGAFEVLGLGTEVDSLTVNGNPAKTTLDNTILKVILPKPLLPGQSAELEMSFLTFFDQGSNRRRMKKFNSGGHIHYDVVHWYPRICVYDRKFGWETDQHLGKEFYGDFGAYDVNITIANHYILDGTGVLVNESEMLPPDLRKQLDISNFARKPIGSPASEIIKPDGTTKTWKYHAENVHDFAFTADPTYRISEARTKDGVRCIALAQERNAAGWQDAAAFTAKVIECYSRDFGQYAYPKMIVADAQDGMEYPMLTLDGGLYPGYHFVIAHEVGHNWFFGMVGNNETYRAALDEGFTQYLTAWSLDRIDGKYPLRYPYQSKYLEKYDRPVSTDERSIYLGYISDAMNHSDARLNTHSDDFSSALGHGGGYRHVYYKTATMLANLQYVLGDSLFTAAMQHYFNQWKFCHPYFDDFRNSIIHYTHTDLNWFFDQWMETTKTLDYSVSNLKLKSRSGKGYTYALTLKRKGEMQSPLDITVTMKNGQQRQLYVPNTYFVKYKDTSSVKVLPMWKGWGLLNQQYTVEITVPGAIGDVQIDTSHRMADIYQLDNGLRVPRRWAFDAQVPHTLNRLEYVNYIRPDIWYNAVDGLKAGVHLNGNYFNRRHVYAATIWYNTGWPADNRWTDHRNIFSARASYRTAIGKDLNLFAEAKYLDGLLGGHIGVEKMFKGDTYRAYVKGLYRPERTDLNYLLYPTLWNSGQQNNTLNIDYTHPYNYSFGNGQILLALRTPFLFSNYDYSSLTLQVTNHNNLHKLEIHTRVYARYITGSNIAPESVLQLAGANNEDLMDSKYTRSQGFVPEEWLGYGAGINHFQAGGGLNLRGYAGYLAPTTINGTVYNMYAGSAGASGSVEIDFDKYIPLKLGVLSRIFHMDTYLFGDAGFIGQQATGNTLRWDHIRADAGAGAALTIKSWGVLQKASPLTLRFDMPFFLSSVPVGQEYFAWRWVVGINRSF